ncbi:unnamed protein product [Amoebophrya sp. A25]|nr:unnamed protein product [Amoebophrya sp. A25]|eukprot:GSA25T00021922001.1
MPVLSLNEDAGNACAQFLQIIDERSKQAGSILAFVSCDVDAICAYKILEEICRVRSISVSSAPATDWESVKEHVEKFEEDDLDVPGLVVLLGCGGMQNLPEFLYNTKIRRTTKLVCLDSQRPLLWQNVATQNEVYVFEDDPDPRTKYSEINTTTDEELEEEEDVLDEDNDGGGRPLKRRRFESQQEQPEDYYKVAWHATPCAVTMLKLARGLEVVDKDLLWLAAVGGTAQREFSYAHEGHCDRQLQFLQEVGESEDVIRPKMFGILTPENEARAARTAPSTGIARDKKNLRYEDDIQAFLYRHQSLMTAMSLTSLVHGRMRLSKDGTMHLKQFFSESGVNPSESQQLSSAMPFHVKSKLVRKFKENERRHNIEGLVGKAFVRHFHRLHGQHQSLALHELSAADTIHIATALLEDGVSLGVESIKDNPDYDPATRKGEINRTIKVNMRKNWAKCYDSLAFMDCELLKNGLNFALQIQQEIEQKAKMLIQERKVITYRAVFKWAKFNIGGSDLFRRPSIVRRLAVWLMEITYKHALKKSHKTLPHLIIAQDDARETSLCVGVIPYQDKGERNMFAHRFGAAAHAAGNNISIKHDFWDPNIVEIATKDWLKFWKGLTSST